LLEPEGPCGGGRVWPTCEVPLTPFTSRAGRRQLYLKLARGEWPKSLKHEAQTGAVRVLSISALIESSEQIASVLADKTVCVTALSAA
jgi:hypothetical protein